MYYAAEGRISQTPIEGGIEISAEQYQAALIGIVRGHVVSIHDGFAVGPKPEPEMPEPEPPTLEELATRKRAEIEYNRHAAFAAGLPYTIAGEPDVVQTRPQDQINLLGLSAKAQRLIAAGDTETTFTFRGLSNVNHTLTASEMDTLALAALAHIEGIYQRSWERKDTIDAILNDEGLDETEKRAAIEAVEW